MNCLERWLIDNHVSVTELARRISAEHGYIAPVTIYGHVAGRTPWHFPKIETIRLLALGTGLDEGKLVEDLSEPPSNRRRYRIYGAQPQDRERA